MARLRRDLRRVLAAIFCAAFSALAHAQQGEQVQGFTCCNLRYEKDAISDVSWTSSPFLPAGSRARLLSFESNTTLNLFGRQANVEIEGKVYRVANPYGRRQETIEQYVGKLIVPVDPGIAINELPENIRAAVTKGKVVRGMTREQVLLSLGFPATHYTPDLKGSTWHYWERRREPFVVHFDAAGQVRAVIFPAP